MESRWDAFFREKMEKICREKQSLLDIGAGLRAIPKKGNRFDPRRAWLAPHLEKLDYKVMDPVPDFEPDVVGDIHKMPFADESQEAIACIAVLEHIEDPIRACEEVRRVLKTGGHALFYVPFLFYYHAERGYYKDFWRFTPDSIQMLFSKFAHMELCPVRGALETWLHISPLGRVPFLPKIARMIDTATGKDKSKQVSGYYVFVTK